MSDDRIKEILWKQLQLLSEHSKEFDCDQAKVACAMCEIAKILLQY